MLETPIESSRYDFKIHTYGCKVNTYDTGLLQKRLQANGQRALVSDSLAKDSRRPRVHILNTCAVTAEATREAAKAARRLKSRDPLSVVVVTGCGAQVDGAVFDELPAADLVIANSHKGQLERILDQHFKGQLTNKVFRSNIFRKEDAEAGGGVESSHTRSFLKIQDGCNSFCTYCVIPFARGKSRSIPAQELIAQINALHARGVNEVVLTGVHIGDYEERRNAGQALVLHDLVRAVIEQTKIPRIRLSSLEPVELTPELIALFKNERMCAHFHMSIQSANTRVLGAMKRQYGADAVEMALQLIASKVPGAFVGMDVIAGFPGESEDEFSDTYQRLERLPWTRLHVFPYSERPGTKAIALPDPVRQNIRAMRAQRLRDLSTRRFEDVALQQVSQLKRALLIKPHLQMPEVLTKDYWPVKLTARNGEILDSETLHRLLEYSEKHGEITIRISGFDNSQASRMDGVLRGVWEEGNVK